MRCNAGIALTLFNSIFNRFRLITILLGTLIVHEFFSGFSSLHVHYYIVYYPHALLHWFALRATPHISMINGKTSDRKLILAHKTKNGKRKMSFVFLLYIYVYVCMENRNRLPFCVSWISLHIKRKNGKKEVVEFVFSIFPLAGIKLNVIFTFC